MSGLFDGLETYDENTTPAGRRGIPSRALIAGDDRRGVLLAWIGFDLYHEIQSVGWNVEDLGLLPDSLGIWIWEGVYTWQDGPFEYPLDGETLPEGKFRSLTDEEWSHFRNGLSLWDEKDWHIPETNE